jgi:ligand-binding SRPBCC domain-containing protein
MHTLIKETLINKPLNEIFDFFSRAENLNKITPPELNFKILSPLPIEMKQGALIDYKIKINGIPFKWKTEITIWEPGIRFVDSQIKGPYKVWIHEHFFEEKDGKTYMRDTVKFLSPGGVFEPIINKFLVEKRVNAIFDYREKVLGDLFK